MQPLKATLVTWLRSSLARHPKSHSFWSFESLTGAIPTHIRKFNPNGNTGLPFFPYLPCTNCPSTNNQGLGQLASLGLCQSHRSCKTFVPADEFVQESSGLVGSHSCILIILLFLFSIFNLLQLKSCNLSLAVLLLRTYSHMNVV